MELHWELWRWRRAGLEANRSALVLRLHEHGRHGQCDGGGGGDTEESDPHRATSILFGGATPHRNLNVSFGHAVPTNIQTKSMKYLSTAKKRRISEGGGAIVLKPMRVSPPAGDSSHPTAGTDNFDGPAPWAFSNGKKFGF
jgi:hypothetical protein